MSSIDRPTQGVITLKNNAIIIILMGRVERKSDVVAIEDQRRRPVYTSAQSDQFLCCSPSWKYNWQTCYTQNFSFLATCTLNNWTGWFESCMVVNPEDRSSRIEAQIISMRQFHFPQIDIFSSSKWHVERLSIYV